MASLSAREKALVRAAMEDEFRRLDKDAQNTVSPDLFRAAYPRMMYKATDIPIERIITTHGDGRPREVSVDNKFAGLLCDTMVAESADEAEILSEAGWDVSPEAAHGVVTGMVAATSAKDDEIAALRAQIAAMQAVDKGEAEGEQVARRRGRPPLVRDEVEA